MRTARREGPPRFVQVLDDVPRRDDIEAMRQVWRQAVHRPDEAPDAKFPPAPLDRCRVQLDAKCVEPAARGGEEMAEARTNVEESRTLAHKPLDELSLRL